MGASEGIETIGEAGYSAAAVLLGWTILFGSVTIAGATDAGEEPRTIRKMCGACPEGYATTGVTNAPEVCKDNDPTLVQCVPLGANMLSVCGSCPDGYTEVGRSNVPARCGSKDSGLMSQCQSQHMSSNLPDPTQGGVTCPPHCGSTAAPGQGATTPPPKFRPSPESK
jgi:hypothetical protein